MAEERTADILIRILTDDNASRGTLDNLGLIDKAIADIAQKSFEASQKAQLLQDALADPQKVNALSQAMAELNSQTRDLAQAQDQLNQAVEANSFYAMQERVRGILAEAEAEDELASKYRDAAAAREEFNQAQQDAIGYGQEGGNIGPAEDDSSGGGGIGSAFALGHGLSVAGHALKAPALSEIGGFIYIEEGIRKSIDLFKDLNATLEASGGLVPALTEALVALNVPMAGIIAAALPIVAAVAAVGAAFALLKSQLDEGKEAVQGAIDRLSLYYKTIETGTTQSINADIEQQEKHRKFVEEQRDQLIAQVQSGLSQAGAGGGAAGAAGQIKYLASGGYQELQKQIGDLNAELGKSQIAIDADKDALKSQTVAENDDAERRKLSTTQNIARIDELSQAELHAQELKQNGTAKAVQAELDANAIKYKNNEDEIARLQALGDNSVEVQQKIQALKDENEKLAVTTTVLIETGVKPYLEEKEKELALLKEVTKANQELNKAREDYAKGVADTEKQATDQAAAIYEKEKKAEAALTQGSLEDTIERTKIITDGNRKRIELEEKTAEQITDIQTKTNQKEYSLRQDFANQIYDDGVKYYSQLNDLRTSEERQEREDAITHAQKLADIQKQSHQSDEQALLDRNFLQLAKNRLGQQTQTDQENQHYQENIEKQRRHEQDQEQDLARHLGEEEAQQALASQRKIKEAERAEEIEIYNQRLAENRKAVEIYNATQQQLYDLSTNERNKILILQRNAYDELLLVQKTEYAKLTIYQQSLDAIEKLQIAHGARERGATETSGSASVRGGVSLPAPSHTFDSGGSFGSGETFLKGDLNETINFGGKGYNLGGSAIVYPLQSGTVTPNSGGSKGSVTINIYPTPGMDATAVAHKVYDILDEGMP